MNRSPIKAIKKPIRAKRPTHKHARALMAAGYPLVAGIDEVGRGCWAGPVVAAAVVLPDSCRLPGVHDSKLLTAAQRTACARLIKHRALAVGIGWVSVAEIDAHGLSWAVQQSGLRALYGLRYPYHAILLDGNHNYLRELFVSQAIIKGDQLSLQIAAASVVAKVARDNYMILQHKLYPEYDFASNKGYGTPHHAAAVRERLSPLHRRLFKPVQLAAAGFTEYLEPYYAVNH
ncbi:MAG TPA: ribonuclease HII [Candidatus Saccharimonadia bacterium]|jgi:ribonuclease HII